MEDAAGMSAALRRDGRRVMQAGSVLFLLSLLVGLAVQAFAAPRIALSTHLLGLMQGTFLIAVGGIWPLLRVSRFLSHLTRYLLSYGCVAAWLANLLGALWAAGQTMIPIAAGTARGTTLQENVIRVMLISSALTLVASVSVLVWGLGGTDATER